MAPRGAWLAGRLKVIVQADGHVEAYDLGDDPGELAPLPLHTLETDWLAVAQQWWSAVPLPQVSSSPDEEQMRRLEALGYLGRR